MKEIRVGKNSTAYYNNDQNLDNYNRYLNEIVKYKPLTVVEEVECFNLIAKGDINAIDTIYKHNLLFVVSVAKKYIPIISGSNITFMDLISEGNLGLHKSINKFDTTRGFKFITYAIWWIRQYILLYISSNYRCFRITSKINQEISQVNKKLQALEQELQRPVYYYDLEQDNNTLNIKKLMGLSVRDISANSTYLTRDDEESSIINRLVSDEPSPDINMIKLDVRKNISNMLDTIPKHIKNYIIDKFGLDGQPPMSYSSIAIKYDESEQTIKNRIDKYLWNLRRYNKLIDGQVISKNYKTKEKIKNRPISICLDTNGQYSRPEFEIINGVKYQVSYLI